MRHPRIVIASISLAAVQGFFVATPGLATVAGSSAPAGAAPAAPAAPAGSGYGY